jgi:hypothetical protein
MLFHVRKVSQRTEQSNISQLLTFEATVEDLSDQALPLSRAKLAGARRLDTC